MPDPKQFMNASAARERHGIRTQQQFDAQMLVEFTLRLKDRNGMTRELSGLVPERTQLNKAVKMVVEQHGGICIIERGSYDKVNNIDLSKLEWITCIILSDGTVIKNPHIGTFDGRYLEIGRVGQYAFWENGQTKYVTASENKTLIEDGSTFTAELPSLKGGGCGGAITQEDIDELLKIIELLAEGMVKKEVYLFDRESGEIRKNDELKNYELHSFFTSLSYVKDDLLSAHNNFDASLTTNFNTIFKSDCNVANIKADIFSRDVDIFNRAFYIALIQSKFEYGYLSKDDNEHHHYERSLAMSMLQSIALSEDETPIEPLVNQQSMQPNNTRNTSGEDDIMRISRIGKTVDVWHTKSAEKNEYKNITAKKATKTVVSIVAQKEKEVHAVFSNSEPPASCYNNECLSSTKTVKTAQERSKKQRRSEQHDRKNKKSFDERKREHDKKTEKIRLEEKQTDDKRENPQKEQRVTTEKKSVGINEARNGGKKERRKLSEEGKKELETFKQRYKGIEKREYRSKVERSKRMHAQEAHKDDQENTKTRKQKKEIENKKNNELKLTIKLTKTANKSLATKKRKQKLVVENEPLVASPFATYRRLIKSKKTARTWYYFLN
jgi:hypothetical protein